MSGVGVMLLLAGLSAAPDAVTVAGPRFTRGDELHYTGEVGEASDRIGNRFRKKSSLEIRVFVLDAGRDSADLAVLTVVRPLDDPAVAQAVVAIGSGRPREPTPPAVRLDLVRVDSRGRAKLLRPTPGPPPLPLATADTSPLVAVPLDTPPNTEVGFLVPLPPAAVRKDSTWDTVEADRPPLGWKATGEAVWNGGRCLELVCVQQSTGFDQPVSVFSGWKRTDAIIVSPTDGYASTVTRVIQRREGRDAVSSVTVKYELQPRNRAVGVKYANARREIETAWALADDLRVMLAAGKKTPVQEFRAKAAKADEFIVEYPGGTAFRPALEAVKRRCESAAIGFVPPAAVTTPTTRRAAPPAVGDLLDDFVLPDVERPSGRFRLSAARGKPVLLACYKPDAVGSKGTLKLATALREKYKDGVRVIPVAVFGDPDAAADERKALKLDIPVFDGREVATPLGIESWPVFVIADGTGKMAWRFDAGIGGETGFLICKELDAALVAKPKR